MDGSSRIVGALAAVAILSGVLGRPELLVAQRGGNSNPHYRVLTVYDAETHHAIDSVQVVDLLAAKFGLPNSRAFTNDSGRVLLAFLRRQHDSAAVQIAKPGYEERRFVVMMGLADTAPVTVALARAKPDPRGPSKFTASKRRFTVFDSASEHGLEGVEVADAVGGSTTLTDARGAATVVITFIASNGMVTLRKVGYAPATLVIEAADTTSTFRQDLSKLVDLAPITATAPRTDILSRLMTGFEERRKVGLGKFVTRDELRKNDGRTLSDALAGLGIVPENRDPRCGRRALVFVDGVRLGTGWTDNLLKAWPGNYADDFDGVEFYSGAAAPAEFSGPGLSCGALVLWTRKQH
jgi:hypothetical protein